MIDNLLCDLDSFSVSETKICNVEDCKHFIPAMDKTFTVLTQNIRSINRNMNGFEVLLQNLGISCDIIVLTECWLSNQTLNLPPLDGYSSYKTNRHINQNDGLVVYIKKNLKATVEEPIVQDSNCLIIEISPNIVVLAVYRPPSQDIDRFLDSLDTLLNKLCNFKTIILIGDININIASGKIDNHAHNYLNICSYHGLLPAYHYPTHQSGSCLDHIILKTKKLTKTFIINSSLTDHNAILVTLQISLPRKNCLRSYNKVNMAKLETDIRSINFDPVYNSCNANTSLNYFIGSLQHAIIKNTFTTIMPRKYSNVKPWITPGLVRCIRHRDKLHLKSKLAPDNEVLSITYKRYRNFCNNLLKKIKIQHDKYELQSAGKNSKLVWKYIRTNTLSAKNSEPALDLLSTDISPYIAADKVNYFFVNVGKNLADKTPGTRTLPYQHQTIGTENPVNSFVLLDTDVDEVLGIISGLKDDCAVGWDDIPNRILKKFKYLLAHPLTHIFQLCLSNGVFPSLPKKHWSPLYSNLETSTALITTDPFQS